LKVKNAENEEEQEEEYEEQEEEEEEEEEEDGQEEEEEEEEDDDEEPKPAVLKRERGKADTEKYNKYIKTEDEEETGTIRERTRAKKGETIASSTDLTKVKSGTIKKKKDELVIKPQDINKKITLTKSVLQKIELAQKEKNVAVVRFSIYNCSHYGETICIVGSIPLLGDWNIQDGLQMQFCDDIWEAEALLPGNIDIEYKYVIVQSQQIPLWEAGANRKVFINPEIAINRCVELRDVWQKILNLYIIVTNSKLVC